MSEASAVSPEERARRAFEQRYGIAPDVVTSAPGRVNLIGEHTDYSGGMVLPIAIAERTAVALGVNAPALGQCEVTSLELGATIVTGPLLDFEPRPFGDPGAWVNAVMGPLRALAEKNVTVPSGMRLVIASDVPIGAGLSSSAALGTSVATAALRHAGLEMDLWTLVRLLQDAEQRFLGTPCGIMDMAVALAARRDHAMLLDCRSCEITHVPLPQSLALVLIESGVRHELAQSAYAERRREVEDATRQLGVPSLRDAELDSLGSLDATLERRARHVISENRRTLQAAEALRREDLTALGALMGESHRSLRDDFEVSHPALDRIVDSVSDRSRVSGALGARMIGGGFGGCVLVLTHRDRWSELMGQLVRMSIEGIGIAIRAVRSGDGYTSRFEEGRSC